MDVATVGGAIFFCPHAEHNLVCAVIGVGPHGSPTSARAKSGGPLLKTPHLWQRPSLFLTASAHLTPWARAPGMPGPCEWDRRRAGRNRCALVG